MHDINAWFERMRAARGYQRTERRTCAKHGDYDADLFSRDGADTESPCPHCAMEKAEIEDRQRWQEAKRAAEQKAIQSRFENAMIPPRFADRTLANYVADTPEKDRVLDFCLAYAARFDEVLRSGKSVIFSGGPGTGKTHLSIGIANIILAEGRTALYSTVSRAVRRIRSQWQTREETEQEVFALFSVPDLLILDEVGIQSGTENEHQILFEILNARYEEQRPTILLTNLPVRDVKDDAGKVTTKGLESYIGERIIDRMREGGGRAFRLDWQSYRGRA